MRTYTIIDTTRGKLKRKIAKKALRNKPLTITARECLDEITARRRQAITVDFRLEINSIHLRDDKFVIAKLVDSDAVARIEFAADAITLTVADFPEADPVDP